ncbi:uncharacterized protein LAJ45_02334 [Morchella importuna]|uniref:uncharacterized protein n=1 Tax=Morchella importuna TaxID=1174673 RepID=UPI001E8D36C1|nr:uncharacterized protein LAJ45_02334 [Morchella importuna]KAH8153521.1 hypothetical protein LAJ45_02334 [Morchella importuna]
MEVEVEVDNNLKSPTITTTTNHHKPPQTTTNHHHKPPPPPQIPHHHEFPQTQHRHQPRRPRAPAHHTHHHTHGPQAPHPGHPPLAINGQPTTSTGTPSLDALLAGHAGLPLGCSVLIEEPGTTDFGGALLRYYAAEGIVQGHAVTVVGVPEAWVRDLPAVTGAVEAHHPFTPLLTHLTTAITTHAPHPHRILLPSLLSPLLYPPAAATPSHLLPFLHALRALLRAHPAVTLMASLPLELYPRASGLVRWAEVLADCVVELTPFGRAVKEEGAPQGLVRVWKVPVVGERGGGVGGAVGRGEDLAFVVTRRRFEIGPYSLPPMEEEEGGGGGEEVGKAKKVDVDF